MTVAVMNALNVALALALAHYCYDDYSIIMVK